MLAPVNRLIPLLPTGRGACIHHRPHRDKNLQLCPKLQPSCVLTPSPEHPSSLVSALTFSISCHIRSAPSTLSLSKAQQDSACQSLCWGHNVLFQKWLKTESENTSLKLIRRVLLCHIALQTFQLHHPIILPFIVTWCCYILLLKKGLKIHLLPKQLPWPSVKRHKNIKSSNPLVKNTRSSRCAFSLLVKNQ